MSLNYLVTVDQPETHLVKVKISTEFAPGQKKLKLFLPVWCPGSYLVREYSRHVQNFRATFSNGERAFHEKSRKNIWTIDLEKSELNNKSETKLTVEYEVYCHELTVRTSHIDVNHAFLHGPTYLMTIEGQEKNKHQVEFRFSALWSKLSTALRDISEKRDVFLYEADDYDELLDCPVEIGCHETDGFMVDGKPHELAFYGPIMAHGNDLKADIKKVVETVSSFMGEIPYEKYMFLTHSFPGLFGGLEHKNSTVLHFDSVLFNSRPDYINWVSLVAHEYFHTWNVKRIRPIELGPFDYHNENYTPMLWLAEGLTSFMDDLFVYLSGICSLEEYLSAITKSLVRYESIPGKRFHSLEESSYDAWIKLYRPDENSNNSSISYYLKGGLVFFILNKMLVDNGSNIKEFLSALWKMYNERPEKGVDTKEVLDIIQNLSNETVKNKFQEMISTTIDLPLEETLNQMGIEIQRDPSPSLYLGITTKSDGGRIIVSSVELDGPSYVGGLNAGDEIISINNLRVLDSNFGQYQKSFIENRPYQFLVSRLGNLQEVSVAPRKRAAAIKALKIVDEDKINSYLKM